MRSGELLHMVALILAPGLVPLLVTAVAAMLWAAMSVPTWPW